MVIRNLTVKLEYRMKAGEDNPRWKAIRGRVMIVSPGGGVTFGPDLFTPNLTSLDAAIAASLAALPAVETLHFIFDEKMNEPKRSYLRGSLLPFCLIQ